MQAYELVLVHTSTLLVSLIAARLFSTHLKRYKDNLLFPSLALALYFLSFAIYYFFIFLLRFPTEEVNLTLRTWVVPMGAFILDPFLPLFGSLFASYTLSPRHGFWLAAPLIALSAYSIITIALNPPLIVEGAGGIAEWIVPPEANRAIIADIFVSAFVCSYLGFYTASVKARDDRIKGLLLTVGFILITYLVHFEENFGTGTMLYLRRALILVSVIMVHLGFTASFRRSKKSRGS